MNEPWEILAEACREEKKMYLSVLDLVKSQRCAMVRENNPSAVLAVCRQVEALMDRIMQKDNSIGGIKKRWVNEGKKDPYGELEALFDELEKIIRTVSKLQESVQNELQHYMERIRTQTERTQSELRSRRAGKVYGGGGL